MTGGESVSVSLSKTMLARQRAVIAWINSSLIPRQTPLKAYTSYGLKHLMSRATGIYITNDQFKDAMLEAGYQPANPMDLNWVFSISKRSPAFDVYKDSK